MAANTTVAVIGTAGRRGSGPMTAATFEWMVEQAGEALRREWDLELADVRLVSGGAAWADHVAVALFLDGRVAGLILHLPAALTPTGFVDTGTGDWRTNPGRSANTYHRAFTAALGRDTLAELRTAVERGAAAKVHKGFHARNRAVARADHLLAFTWGRLTPPKGGTRHTWSLATSHAHVSLARKRPASPEPGSPRKKAKPLAGAPPVSNE